MSRIAVTPNTGPDPRGGRALGCSGIGLEWVVNASRRIVGPDGETQASLIIALTPPRSSQED